MLDIVLHIKEPDNNLEIDLSVKYKRVGYLVVSLFFP